MKKISGPNVAQPNEFNSKLHQLMGNMFDLFELTKEYEYPTRSENSVCGYDEKYGKRYIQASAQYERSDEFLRVLLDVTRVIFDPCFTFFLNGNPSYIFNWIPSIPFRLGYVSLVSNGDEDFTQFYSNTVAAYIEACGYDITQVSATYAVVSFGGKSNWNKLVEEVCFKLESAFSVYIVNDPARNNDERACTRNYDTDVCIPKERCYAGFCYDPALENRIRLSMWFFIPDQSNGVETQAVN